MPLLRPRTNGKKRSILKIGIAIVAVIIILQLELISCVGTYFSWADYDRVSNDMYIIFIGSSAVQLLGCWPKNVVKSVDINTSSIILYSSDPQQDSLESVIYFNELNISGAIRPDLDSHKPFQIYYHDPLAGLFTVYEGYIVYFFTVELNYDNEDEIHTAAADDNCTLEIFTFDSYFEFSKYLTGTAAERIQYLDRMCLNTEDKVGHVFVVNITLPAQQFTYIAGIANSGVKVLTYYASEGLVAAYDTSRLNQKKCHHDGDDDCQVTIGGKYAGVFNWHRRCVFVIATQISKENPYVYIATKVMKAYIVAAIITCVAVATLVLFGCIILVLCYKTRACGALIKRPQQEVCGSDEYSTNTQDDTASDHHSTPSDDSLLLKSPIDEQKGVDDYTRSINSWSQLIPHERNTNITCTRATLSPLGDETTYTDPYSVEGKQND